MGIPGIPTKHKGRQYRSRLEARWATYFDMLGWRYEYEPFDLAGWIPDFVLLGTCEDVLVEIKPVVSFPEDVADKIKRAEPEQEVLILGCTIPVRTFDESNDSCVGWISISHGWDDAVIGDIRQCYTSSGEICRYKSDVVTRSVSIGFGLCPLHPPGHDRISGKWEGIRMDWSYDVIGLWTEAGNQVQWKAPRPG